MVTRCATDSIVHTTFRDFASFLEPGDLVVANDSGTLAAALTATRYDGAEFALHLSSLLPTGAWVVEPRKTAASPGETVAIPGGGKVHFIAPYRDSARLWVALVRVPGSLHEYLAQYGHPIRYPYVLQGWPIEMYQTVYAGDGGSAEMPSAGRPISLDTIAALRARGVRWATLTLHTGVASLESGEAPYEEWFRVPPETADAVNRTRAAGGRVIAVGTTVVRALESAADPEGRVHVARGWTGLVITPERGVRAVDGLLTGFHEPRATHLWMLEAITCRRRHLRAAYEAALAQRYLWHEFGDVHLIL